MGEDSAISSFEGLPQDILLIILSFLPPEHILLLARLNTIFKSLTQNDFLWKNKTVDDNENPRGLRTSAHFNYRYPKDARAGIKNWQEEFKKSYTSEYKTFPQLFSMVKENDLASLTLQKITLQALCAGDSSEKTLRDWAILNHNQPILKHLFKSILSIYLPPDKIEDFDINKKEQHAFLNVDIQDTIECYTILHWAILYHQPESFISSLIDLGADINAGSSYRNTPIMTAAQEGRESIVKLLIDKKADLDIQTTRGATALLMAIENGHFNIAALLLSNGASFNRSLWKNCHYHNKFNIYAGDTPLSAAIKLGHLETIKLMHTKQPGGIHTLFDYTHSNMTLTSLMLASASGQADIVDFFLQKNAEINRATVLNATPLFFAIENGHTQVVSVLLKYHADLTPCLIKNGDYHKTFNLGVGDNAWSAALKGGHVEIVKMLVEKGCNLEASVGSYTPLMLAAMHNRLNLVEYLLSQNVSINIQREDGTTALLLACERSYSKIVRLLLNAGADATLSLHTEDPSHASYGTKNGETPVEIAKRLADEETIQVFKNYAVAKTLIQSSQMEISMDQTFLLFNLASQNHLVPMDSSPINSPNRRPV